MLKYYNICAEPEKLSDEEWALQFALLNKVRKMEASNETPNFSEKR
jgi:hypothetical protein